MKELLNISEELLEKYKSITIIFPVYKSEQKEYTINDFKELYDVKYYLGEVSDGEACFTPSGISFLDDHFGLNNLAELLYKEGWRDYQFTSKDQIFEWLKSWEEESKKYSNFSPKEE